MEVGTQISPQLLHPAQEIDLVRAGTVGNVRVVDPAVAESGPVAPNQSLILMIATLAGALLAIGFVLLRRLLNPGLDNPETIERLGLPVYAAVPFSDRQAQLERRRRPAAGSDPLPPSPLLALGHRNNFV